MGDRDIIINGWYECSIKLELFRLHVRNNEVLTLGMNLERYSVVAQLLEIVEILEDVMYVYDKWAD